jgi:aspartate aminotransferase
VSYPDQVIAAGAKPVAVPMPKGPGAADALARAPLRIEDLERAATPKTTAIVLNSPNNPAGYVFDKAFLLELGAYLKTKSWWIVSDEIYEYLAFDRPHESLLTLFPELRDRYILVNGMSKGFAMTGWRVGYAAGPAAPMKLVRDLQSHSSTCLPPFIEDAATFALGQGRSLLAHEIDGLKARRDLAAGLAKAIPGVRLAPPQGAFYLFLDVNEPLAKGAAAGSGVKDSYALSELLLTKHHIAMVPGDAFGAPGWLRLSYATDQATIKEGMARLHTALTGLGGR